MTQDDLAAAINVDQGTISRWERSVESPRPANLHALKGLNDALLGRQTKTRLDNVLSNNLYQAALIDQRGRNVRFSDLAIAHFRKHHDIDLQTLVGRPFQTLMERSGKSDLFAQMKKWGGLDGIYQWSRFYTNARGLVTCNELESIFEGGEFVGTLLFVPARYRIVDNEIYNLAKVEATLRNDPGRVQVIYKGQFAEHILPPGTLI